MDSNNSLENWNGHGDIGEDAGESEEYPDEDWDCEDTSEESEDRNFLKLQEKQAQEEDLKGGGNVGLVSELF